MHRDSRLTPQPRIRRHPDWIKIRPPSGPWVARTSDIVKRFGLTTVCEEAQCPNLSECWSHATATFMLLGEVCTRGCRFCAVTQGKPPILPDPEEANRVAGAVCELGLRHVVLTSVARDDLADQGSNHFAATARAIRRRRSDAVIEVLIPDFQGKRSLVQNVLDSPINILNHNVETVPRLYRRVRPGAKYNRSLEVLKWAGEATRLRSKAGLMLGLGEEKKEILQVLMDLRAVGCQILTIGQYLQPSKDKLPVERYIPPEEFKEWKIVGLELGFSQIESNPLVRSSYNAWAHVD